MKSGLPGVGIIVRVGAAAAICFTAAACGGARPTPEHPAAERVEPVAVIVAGADADPSSIRPRAPRVTVHVAAEPAPPAVAQAAPLLERARTRYRDLAFEESLAAVGEAQVILERAPRTAEDFAALHQALAYRAMDELALGRQDRARAAIESAVALDPRATLDEGQYPPDLRALYEEVRTAARAAAPVGLPVTSEPTGATIEVDGREAGTTPATVHATPGQHYLRLSAVGYAPRVLAVSFSADAPPLSVSLPAAGAGEAVAQAAALDGDALAGLPTAARRALADALSAGAILRVAPAGGGAYAGTLVDLSGGSARPVGPVTGPLSSAVDAMVDAARGTPAAADEDEDGILDTPAFWIVAGAAVIVGAAVGAYFLLRDPGHEVVLQ